MAAVEFSSSISSSHDGNRNDGPSGTSGTPNSGEDGASAPRKAAASSRPRPRSPLAMAAFDYQEEVVERIREEGTMP